MNAMTPTARAVLDALHEAPAAAAELRQRLGRSRSAIDKALADLAHNQLAAKSDQDRWAPTDQAPPAGPDNDAAVATDEVHLPAPVDIPSDTLADDAAMAAEHATSDSNHIGSPEDAGLAHAVEETIPTEVKICRGCQAQMPMVCPTCGSKTTSYCADCRRQQPARRRGSGQPEILSSGLPKLGRGELVHLVRNVMRTQPLPDHLGMTGWTAGRVAVFLPGRSTGAIGNALERLTTTGVAVLLGETPKRYRLATGDDSDDPSEVDDTTLASDEDAITPTVPASHQQ
jgi:hypothetical protein